MEKEINNNGYDYVDLKLPSGTLWATCNVGAKKTSDAGLYFQWGDTKGYTKDQVGIGEDQKAFTWADYKYSIKGTSTFFTKYEKKYEVLEIEDDAAHINMGGDWHMPTPDQINELIDNTTSEWMEQDGVKGKLFTSKKDASKSIFIPAAGVASNVSVYNNGKIGYIWSSMLSDKYATYGMNLGFFVSRVRYLGMPVRGVIG